MQLNPHLLKYLNVLKLEFAHKILVFKNVLSGRNPLRQTFEAMEQSGNQVKINIGCGSGKFKEASESVISRGQWINTDIIGPVPFHATKIPKFLDEKVHLFFSSHVVEHLTFSNFCRHLTQIHKALLAGGEYVIATPCMRKITTLAYSLQDGDSQNEFICRHAFKNQLPPTGSSALNAIIHLNYGHEFIHDFDTISGIAKQIGFSDVCEYKSHQDIENVEIKNYVCARSNRYRAESMFVKLIK